MAKAITDLKKGIEVGAANRVMGGIQLLNNVAEAFGVDREEAKRIIAEAQRTNSQIGESLGPAGFVGEIVGDPLTYAPAGKWGSALLTSAGAGLTAPTGNAEDGLIDNVLNAGQGAAFGLGAKGIADTISRGLTGASDKVTDEVRDAVARLRQRGVEPRMSQITDSRLLKNIDAVLPDIPGSGALASQGKSNQAYTQALAKTFGVGDLSTTSMGEAKNNLSKMYSDILSGKEIPSQGLYENLIESANKIKRGASSANRQFIDDQVSNIQSYINPQTGVISGPDYQDMRRALKQASGEYGPIKELIGAVDDTVRANAPNDIATGLAKADEQYRNFKISEKLANQAQNADAAMGGPVNPSTVFNVAKQSIPSIGTGGGGEFGQLARDARIMRQTVPDSGTARRVMTGAGLTGIGGAIGYSQGEGGASDLGYAGLGALGTMGLARGLNKAMTSRALQNYAMSGLPGKAAAQAISRSGIAPKAAAIASTQPQGQQPMAYNPDSDPEIQRLLSSQYNPDNDPEIKRLLGVK